MKKQGILIALIFSMVFNVAFLCGLGYRVWEKKRSKEFSLHSQRHYRKERIVLSPEQKEQRDRIRKTFSPKIQSIRSELHRERCALGDLLMKDEPDTVLIEKKIDQIGKLQTDIEREVIYHLLREKSILTPDQRQQFLNTVLRRLGERPPSPRGSFNEKSESNRPEFKKEENKK